MLVTEDMTILEFELLSKERKSRKLFYKGVHLITKDYENFSTALYHYNDFFVEVVYLLDTLETVKINSYRKLPNVDLYLDEISIVHSVC